VHLSSTTADPSNLVRAAVEELVRRWRVLIMLPLLAAVVALVASFAFRPRFQSVAVFAPAQTSTQSLPASLQSIASQFGFALPSSGYSVYYFAQVLHSRSVLETVARDTLRADGQILAVMDLLNVKKRNPERELDDAVRALEDRIDVQTDDQANLVGVRTQGPSPHLAEALGKAVLLALDSIITLSHRTGGSYERRFAQAQADSARNALRSAEDQLRDFYKANRSITSSPTLQVEEGRLRRQIQVLQDVYLALMNQEEAGKLQEARNTPAISIVQPPLASSKKVWPRRAVWGLFAMIASLLAVSAWLYVVVPALKDSPLAKRPGFWQRMLSVSESAG
jgi:uncharacterized protein involved in exopolysaccharide biosynthesis